MRSAGTVRRSIAKLCNESANLEANVIAGMNIIWYICTLYSALFQVVAPARSRRILPHAGRGRGRAGLAAEFGRRRPPSRGPRPHARSIPLAGGYAALSRAGRRPMGGAHVVAEQPDRSRPVQRAAGRILVLHGFIKKTQKTPADDLALALAVETVNSKNEGDQYGEEEEGNPFHRQTHHAR